MTLNSTLLAMLACPSDDHAPLREESRDGVDTLVCSFCASRFPVQDGIPVLLLDDATPGPRGIGVAADSAPPVAPAESAPPVPPVLPASEVVAAEQPPTIERPLTVDAFAGRVPFDPRLSPRHALPDPADQAEPAEPIGESGEPEPAVQADPAGEVEPVAALDVEPEPYVEPEPELPVEPVVDTHVERDAPTVAPTAHAAPASTRPVTPPPGARFRTGSLRDRVQQRLAEIEATRGPRGKRRGGTGT